MIISRSKPEVRTKNMEENELDNVLTITIVLAYEVFFYLIVQNGCSLYGDV